MVSEAIAAIEVVLENINLSKRVADAQSRLALLQGRLDAASPALVTPSRMWIADFDVSVLRDSSASSSPLKRDKAEYRGGFVCLCNEGVYLAWQSGPLKKMLLKGEFPLRDCTTESLGEAQMKISLSGSEAGDFRVIRFQSDEVLNAFESALHEAKKPSIPSRKTPPPTPKRGK